MTNNFTTSINIIRDSERDFNYIPTHNSKQVVNQIINDFKKGIKSFNIIGNYGTGKSSFLLALEQSLRGKKKFFETNLLSYSKVEFVKIIGSYESIVERFTDIFGVDKNNTKNEDILQEISKRFSSQIKKSSLLFLIVDEFGKFLEYAAQNTPEKELYFVQQLAELCNSENHNIIFITTVHQSFESYSFSLNTTQKQEWAKVKGRFKEVIFNEPVEQLLFLACEYISANQDSVINKGVVDKCSNLAVNTKAFDFSLDLINKVAHKLYPLDIISASVLTLSLQRYAQNERSLFSFLESTDHTSLSKFNNSNDCFYNLSNVFDYLNFNFYPFLNSKYNPDFSSWASIRSALEETERSFDDSINDFTNAIKCIGLLNIFSASGAILDRSFLKDYLEISCGIRNAKNIIERLERKKIIIFRNHSHRFILFDGTDLDIETALYEAGNKLSEVTDVTTLLNKHFQFSPVCAKQYSYIQGTPRYFEFVISEYPISKAPEGEIDGYINLIFSEKIASSKIEEISAAQEEAIIYGHFENSAEIKNLLFEIEKIRQVISENEDDKVAKRELENISIHQKNLLKHYIVDNLYNSKTVNWYWKGSRKSFSSKKEFNKMLSQICFCVYSSTPVFKNELVNKHRISSSIHTAKRNYLKALTNNWNKENLGFEDDKFPPEKTIFITLLKEQGIFSYLGSTLSVDELNESSSFKKLWSISEKFLESAKLEKKSVSDFGNVLRKRPFKLKQGLIDFWVPSFLFLKRDDFALFGGSGNGYIPNLTNENLELLVKDPSDYSIKAFNVEGVRLDIFNNYRTFLNQATEDKINNHSFIETIKPFLTFYRQLPDYSKNTKRLMKEAIKIRQAIAISVDPEATFFEDFPAALGFNIQTLQQDKDRLQEYTSSLQMAIRELRTCYDSLLDRFEDFIRNEVFYEYLEFEEYKQKFQFRFRKLKKHLLLPNQKVFIQRIDSPLDDRSAWLNSVAQSVIGKSLETFRDEDEILLYSKFKSLMLELDSLTNISKSDLDEKKEEILSVKIDSFFSSIDSKIIRFPKSKSGEIEEIKQSLKKELTDDDTINIAALINLLKDLLQ